MSMARRVAELCCTISRLVWPADASRVTRSSLRVIDLMPPRAQRRGRKPLAKSSPFACRSVGLAP